MILKILLILFCMLAILAGVIIFSPILFAFNNKEKPYNAAVFMMHIFHPLFIRYTYVFSLKKYELIFFNKFKTGSLIEKEDMEPVEDISDDEKEISDILHETEGSDLSEKIEQPEEKVKEEEETVKPAAYTPEPDKPYIPPPPPKTEPKEEYQGRKPDKKKVKEKELFRDEKFEEEPESTLGSKYRKLKKILQFTLAQKKIAVKALKWLQRVINKCFRLISFNYFSMNIKAGFEEPALTGVLHGFFVSLYHGLDMTTHKQVNVDFKPVFNNEDVFFFEGAVSIKTSIAQLLRPAITAVFTFPYISAFILWRRFKKIKVAMKEP